MRQTNLKQGAQIHQLARPGQYLTQAHSHITRAAATMDRCFALIGAHQHGIAVGQRYRNVTISHLQFKTYSYSKNFSKDNFFHDRYAVLSTVRALQSDSGSALTFLPWPMTDKHQTPTQHFLPYF